MEKLNIATEFKKNVGKRFSNPHLAHIYLKLFSLLGDDELEEILLFYKKEYKKNSDWFYSFHKSIRQTDFFEIEVIRPFTQLNKEQTKRQQVLQKKPIDRLSLAEVDELKSLNHAYRKREKLSNGGLFDVMLWEVIHLDKKNELKDVMELTFKMCE